MSKVNRQFRVGHWKAHGHFFWNTKITDVKFLKCTLGSTSKIPSLAVALGLRRDLPAGCWPISMTISWQSSNSKDPSELEQECE